MEAFSSGRRKIGQLFGKFYDGRGMRILNALSAFQNLFWPPRCVACNERLTFEKEERRFYPFCPLCAQSLLPISPPYCLKCSLAFDSAGPNRQCGECLAFPPPFQKARALFQYGAASKDAVLRLKYGRMPWIGNELGKMLHPLAAQMTRPDMLVPVPLHPKRLRSRGFNQSALLAEAIAEKLKCPLNANSLKRIRDTPPQAGRSRQARKSNIKGAFLCPNKAPLHQKRILLIDDVITTGMTVREAARVLLEAGVESVEVLAFARVC